MKPIKMRSFSIKRGILVTYIALFALVFLAAGIIVFSNWKIHSEEMMLTNASEISMDIENQVLDFVEGSFHLTNVHRFTIQSGVVDLTNETERNRFFVGILRSHDDYIYSVGYGTQSGEYYGARRNSEGNLEIMKNDATTFGHTQYFMVNDDMTAGAFVSETANVFDPRTRDWYLYPQNEGQPMFSPIYKHFVMNDLTISAGYPLYDDEDQLLGVFAAHVILTNLNLVLSPIVQSKHGMSAIIETTSGNVVANSWNQANYLIGSENTFLRLPLQNLSSEVITLSYDKYIATTNNQFQIISNGVAYYAHIEAINRDGIDWLLVTAIPEEFVSLQLSQNTFFSLLFLVFTAIIMLLYHQYYIRKVFRPLIALTEVTQQYRQGDFSARVHVARMDEVGIVAEAINQLAGETELVLTHLEEMVEERTHNLDSTLKLLQESNDRLKVEAKSRIEDERLLDLFFKQSTSGFFIMLCDEPLEWNDSIDKELALDYIFDHQHITKVNPSMLEQYHISEAELKKMTPNQSFSHDLSHARWIWREMLDHGHIHCVTKERRSDGVEILIEGDYIVLYDENGRFIGHFGNQQDVTEQYQKQKEIEYISRHDFLTGLCNRKTFVEAYRDFVVRRLFPIGMIMIDLNGLKIINDAYGHNVGDFALKDIAHAIQITFGSDCVESRIGGDEFAVLVPKTNTDRMQEYKQEFKRLTDSMVVMNIHLSVAIGYDIQNEHEFDFDTLLKSAENFMYRNKMAEGVGIRNQAIQAILQTLTQKYEPERIHSERVGAYAKEIGIHLGLQDEDLKELELAGLFHDIGKISIPDAILNKPGKLAPSEYDIIKTHPEVGYQILRAADKYSELAIHALRHHERWDGLGYPNGLKATEIPLFSRIIAVVDAFEAMTSNRPYRTTMSIEGATAEILRCSGTQFDPDIVRIFVEKVIPSIN